ncbi:TIR domain-containing protein [Chryseobacterium sp. Marseille-Q8038]
MKCFELEYDVVLSFAGEDRKYVEQVAKHLKNKGVKVFYDSYETVNLWGKDLYQHLDNIYQRKAKYAVIFISGEHIQRKYGRIMN